MKIKILSGFLYPAFAIVFVLVLFFSHASLSIAAGGMVSANQTIFNLASGQIGTVTIKWSTSDNSVGQVYVSTSGSAEKLFVQDSKGSQVAPWIVAPNTYTFNLYAGTSHATLLASTTVTAQLIGGCASSADCSAGNLCLRGVCKTNNRSLAVFGGIYGAPLADYINKISQNFTGIESLVGGLQQSQIDALHAKGFKAMAHCNRLADCLSLVQRGVDILAFDEWKLNYQHGVSTENLTGADFNLRKSQFTAINPNIEVGIVEAFIPQYLSYYNEGAKPDFIGLEQYRDNTGNLISPYPSYADFVSQVGAKFPQAKIHIWSNEVKAVELYQNKADLLVYFNIDNHCCSMALLLPFSAVESELTSVYGSSICVPMTCSALAYTCGNVSDGCRKILTCGTCVIGQSCFSNRCVTCIPGSVLGCRVCKSDGSAWANDNSKCSTGSICSAGVCLTAKANPIGFFDGADCSGFGGWTCDADNYNQPLAVHFYADGLAGSGGTFVGAANSNLTREAAVGKLCGGNANHGFSFATPAILKDGKKHTIYAYAINIPQGANPLLGTNAKVIQCAVAQAPTASNFAKSISQEAQANILTAIEQIRILIVALQKQLVAIPAQ